jgi:hypothetical protein
MIRYDNRRITGPFRETMTNRSHPLRGDIYAGPEIYLS